MKLEEIAYLAGVSRTTASYVINGKARQYRVSDKTVEKVMAVVRQHNFQPNAVAAGLRAGKTASIGLVIPDLENNSYTRIANYLEHQARKLGYQLLIACSEDQPDSEMKCVNHLLQRKVDALVVSPLLPLQHPFYQEKASKKLPIIALDRALDPKHFVSVVGTDLIDAETLAKELCAFPLSTILYIGALPELSVSHLREQGFKKIINQHTDYKVDFVYADSFNQEAIAEPFDLWLNEHELPDALFITSFSLLQGVVKTILRKKKRLPTNMIIATFGDSEWLDFLECSVLSLSQQHQQIATKILELVLSGLNDVQKLTPGLVQINRLLMRRGGLSRV